MHQIYPYFAYGSNLNHAGMAYRARGARPDRPAYLEGWRLVFRGVADIEPASFEVVHGALWLLTREDVLALDRYEGAPSLYEQRHLEVETEAGPVHAVTYVMTSGSYLGLPSASYYRTIEAGFEDWDLPVEALRRAVQMTRIELERRGVTRFEPDGPKRLRGVVEYRAIDSA